MSIFEFALRARTITILDALATQAHALCGLNFVHHVTPYRTRVSEHGAHPLLGNRTKTCICFGPKGLQRKLGRPCDRWLQQSKAIGAWSWRLGGVPKGSEAKPLPAAKADLGSLLNFQHAKKSSVYLSGYTCGFFTH